MYTASPFQPADNTSCRKSLLFPRIRINLTRNEIMRFFRTRNPTTQCKYMPLEPNDPTRKTAGPREGNPTVNATTSMDRSDTLTKDQSSSYKDPRLRKRDMLKLVSLTLLGVSVLGGVSIFKLNISLPSIGRSGVPDAFKRTAEITFPPPGSEVPRTVYLRGHAANIAHTEDLRVEVKHKTRSGIQYFYKPVKFGNGDEIYRDDHHFGLAGEDVGDKFWTQLVVVKNGANLNEDVYNEPQAVERLGKQTCYIRRACTVTEKLSPESWRDHMVKKSEIL